MTDMTSKLRFRVVSATSEDEDHPAEELNTVNPSTKGWHSVRFCSFPQELGFELIDGDSRMSQIQILSHQSKISSKIEIFVGKGDSYSSASFKRLGYLSLDNNERSSYNARELKTVFVDYIGRYLKLLVNENHTNNLNIYGQVGIIAVSILGNENHTDYGAKSVDSKQSYNSRPEKSPVNNYNDLTIDLNLDPLTASKLRQLAEAKARAIADEDYLTAKNIKQVEQDLKLAGSKLAQLDMAKVAAVRDEDYDLAKEIKDQTDAMRKEIEKKIMAISIPGVHFEKQISPRKPNFAPPTRNEIEHDDYREDYPPVVKAKTVARIEPMDNNYNNNVASGSYDDDDRHLDIMDRPIKPKANAAVVEDPAMVEYENEGESTENQSFAPGEHPLEGVTGFQNQIIPDNFPAKTKELCDSTGITALLGELRARCLVAKNFTVRETAFNKVILMVKEQFAQNIAAHLPALCSIISLGVEDKIQQVLTAAVQLMEVVLKATRSAKLTKTICVPPFEPIISLCLEKQNDGNARLRDGGRRGLDLMAQSNTVGPQVVAAVTLKPIPAKLKTAWRPLFSRIQLLASLVQTFGLQNQNNLAHEPMLNYLKNNQAFAHSNVEVRTACKDLVTNIYRITGREAVEPFIKDLRSKQKEEYNASFADVAGGGENSPNDGHQAESKSSRSVDSRTDSHKQHPTHVPGGKVNTSAQKASDSKNGFSEQNNNQQHNQSAKSDDNNNGGEGDAPVYTSCMFCGVHNALWTENDLDVHYWKDCPLLISCPSCAQIVEIAGLPEHQLDECDAKGSYVPCEITGLAIRSADIDSWNNSSSCKPAPDNCMYCPLCLASVEDSDIAWLRHLTDGCPKNARTNGL